VHFASWYATDLRLWNRDVARALAPVLTPVLPPVLAPVLARILAAMLPLAISAARPSPDLPKGAQRHA